MSTRYKILPIYSLVAIIVAMITICGQSSADSFEAVSKQPTGISEETNSWISEEQKNGARVSNVQTEENCISITPEEMQKIQELFNSEDVVSEDTCNYYYMSEEEYFWMPSSITREVFYFNNSKSIKLMCEEGYNIDFCDVDVENASVAGGYYDGFSYVLIDNILYKYCLGEVQEVVGEIPTTDGDLKLFGTSVIQPLIIDLYSEDGFYGLFYISTGNLIEIVDDYVGESNRSNIYYNDGENLYLITKVSRLIDGSIVYVNSNNQAVWVVCDVYNMVSETAEDYGELENEVIAEDVYGFYEKYWLDEDSEYHWEVYVVTLDGETAQINVDGVTDNDEE